MRCRKKRNGILKQFFTLFTICFLICSELSLALNVLGQTNNTGALTVKQAEFNKLSLDNSISFKLNSTQKCHEIRLNFTSVNETRDFVNNGDFTQNSDGWDANNKTDIKFEWKEDSKCISINITGNNSKTFVRPMNDSLGVENFQELDGWDFKTNDITKMAQKRDPVKGHPIGDTSGSLMHRYNGTTTKMANSTYEFFHNSSVPLYNISLSYWYYFKLDNLKSNKIEIGTYITNPSKESYLINDTKIMFQGDDETFFFINVKFKNISKYFNETGDYNLTFYSIHEHNNNIATYIYFDYIELIVAYRQLEIIQNTTMYWNQSIAFDRDVYDTGLFNFSYYMTDIFDHINTTEIYLVASINGHRINVDNLKSMTEKSWVEKSLTISENIIEASSIELSLGLFFNNSATYIYPNETFSIFFDQVSFKISTFPTPSQIDLKVFVHKINSSYEVKRDDFNNDYVRIINNTVEICGLNQTGLIDITCNSPKVITKVLLTYYVIQIQTGDNDDEDDEDNGEPKPEEIINVSIVIMALILILTMSSFVLVMRFEKRFFLNPRFDYIKKLEVKKKDREKAPPPKRRDLKICATCGKPINARASFCEHCGKTQ